MGISDEEWAKRLGIKCQYPDGADRCEGCPHYQHPDVHPVCSWAPAIDDVDPLFTQRPEF